VRFLALLQAFLASMSATVEQPPDAAAALTPREKAALVVVSGLPAPPGVAGVIVRRWDRDAPRPRRALVFVDQEGGTVKAFPELPPWQAASSFASVGDAFASGRATGRALRRAGVHVDLAPVLDSPDGPLGSRHFSRAAYGVAFSRGLAAGRAGACAKHFPGLGSTPISTDEGWTQGRLRPAELARFRAAVRVGVPCVMVGHAVYPRLGKRRASLEAATYRLLRSTGFDGVAITDSLGVLGSPYGPFYARLAVRAGADLVLFTSARDARRAIDALVPLAAAGELDEHVDRVLRWRRSFGLR
jgi:beta-N-acetylhexosaminidase